MAISIYNIFWSLTILATFANSLNYYVRDPSEKTDISEDDDDDYLSRNRRHLSKHSYGPTCWSVSRYGNMSYDQEPCQKCKPKFDTVIKPSCKKVCQPVTHESCQLVASTECDSVDIRASYKTVDDEYNYFDYHVCQDITVTECHNKTRPKCVTEQAYNCVVGWKMLDDGTKVPDVYKDDCKPVTWEDCTGVETYCAPFEKDMVQCIPELKIPYCQCKETKEYVNLKKVTCKPKVKAVCEPVTEEICAEVCWEDTEQTVVDECVPGMSWVPKQEYIHEERCLLDAQGKHYGSSEHHHDHHNHVSSSSTSYGAPQAPTYPVNKPTYHPPNYGKTARSIENPIAPALGPTSDAQLVYKDNYQWTPLSNN